MELVYLPGFARLVAWCRAAGLAPGSVEARKRAAPGLHGAATPPAGAATMRDKAAGECVRVADLLAAVRQELATVGALDPFAASAFDAVDRALRGFMPDVMVPPRAAGGQT